MKKVLEHIRVSTEAQSGDDRASIPAQRAVNRQTCQRFGLEVVRTFELTDVSGSAILQAPEMLEMMEMMKSPEIYGVVTREFSRLMRPDNYADYAILQHFVDTKTCLCLPDGAIDFSSRSGRLLGPLQAMMAGEERIALRERSLSAREQMRRDGKCPSGYITWPFGVAYGKDAGWYYTPDAEKVREVFRLVLSGETSWTLVSRHTGISRYAIPVILSNPIYTGWRVYSKRRDQTGAKRGIDGRQGDSRKIARAPEDVIKVKVIDQPIVSEREFATVQEVLKAKQSRHWRGRLDTQHRFTYNGFLTCAACSGSVWGVTTPQGDKHYDYYVCSNRKETKTCNAPFMRRKDLESRLDEMFSEQLTSPEFISSLFDSIRKRNERKPERARVERLQRQVESLKTKRERVMEAFFDGVITREQRDSKLTSLDTETRQAERLLAEHRPEPGIDPSRVAELFEPLKEWMFLDREDKRRILSTLVPEIKVEDYEITGLYLIPGSGFGDYVSHRTTVPFVANPYYLQLAV